MNVQQICTPEVHVVSPNDTVLSAAEEMRERKVGTLVVLNEEREPIGMVTDRDLVVRVVALGKDPQVTRIAEVMTAEPELLAEDTSVESALSLMRNRGFRRYPVVDEQRRLTGLLSLDDVLILLADDMKNVGRLLDQQRPQPAAVS